MANELTRRNFIKAGAAAALVVSVGSLLGGCASSDDPGYPLGEFRIYYTRLKPVDCNAKGKDTYTVAPSVQIYGIDSGLTAKSYAQIFSASANGTALKLTNGTTVGVSVQGLRLNYTPTFEVPDDTKKKTTASWLYDQIVDGNIPIELNISLSGKTMTLQINAKTNTCTPV